MNTERLGAPFLSVDHTAGGNMPESSHDQLIGNVTRFEIEDRNGNIYATDYFRFGDDVLTTLADPRVQAVLPSIIESGKAAFPHYTDAQVESLIKGKVQTAKSLGLIYKPQTDETTDRQVIGSHLNIVQEINHKNLPAKVMYLNQVGLHP